MANETFMGLVLAGMGYAIWQRDAANTTEAMVSFVVGAVYIVIGVAMVLYG